MDLNRFVLMTLLEVVSELVRRLGQVDLFERCDECRRECDAQGDAERKAGEIDGESLRAEREGTEHRERGEVAGGVEGAKASDASDPAAPTSEGVVPVP